MPFVPVRCTQCNSKLNVDSNKKEAKCPYCNTTFVLEEAINNYEINNITNIKELHAEHVHLETENRKENLLKAGEDFLKIGDYASAEKKFLELVQDYPSIYRGWWGLIIVKSYNFTNFDISGSELLYIKSLFDTACTFADAEQKDSMSAKYTPYYNSVKSKLSSEMDKAYREIRKISIEQEKTETDIKKRINDLNKEKKSKEKTTKIIIIASICVIVFFLSVIMTTNQRELLIPLFIVLGVPAFIVGASKIIPYFCVKIERKYKVEIESLTEELSKLPSVYAYKRKPFISTIKRSEEKL